ncbi:AzlC family ABC transporter permease [Rhizobium sp. KVB221]|uniref:AzlC family ABC transporter permease n=1 Tax=Rhizobium setariae TaxID=2801340 RepID=A0A936YM08_9HYPH|nr:AzlC family ABC transporter permease [Rhizobium setariae]MBL0371207.1 AzlC family ABC transporter permease [Rhizobium setariae]
MTWRTEFFDGVKTIAPILVAAVPIGLVFGAVAASKGLSPLEATLMSALVFAGGSQFVAMDIWTHPASWSALGFAALLVNIRHMLMGASIGRRMQAFAPWQKYLGMLVMADENWAMSEARAAKRKLTPAFWAGLSVPFYLNWVVCSLIGALIGAFLGDPAVIGLDFAFPAVFIVLVMSFWKGPATGLVLIASAAAAIVVHQHVPGAWYIAAGAAAGLLAALLNGSFRRLVTQ